MLEVRSTIERVEFRGKGKNPVAVGYAYKFGQLSQNLGGFVEVVERGAGAKSIAEQDIVSLLNHDPNMLLGRKSATTLRMEEDEIGGRYEVSLPNTSVGRDVAELLERGDIIGSSFGFVALRNGTAWKRTSSGFPMRVLRAFKLRDAGPVTFPSYLGADVALRSLAEERSMPWDEVSQAAHENRLAEILFTSGTKVEPPAAKVTHHALF
jgi:uncharacterized protein